MKKLSLLLPLVIMTACTTQNADHQRTNTAMQAPSNFSCEQGGVIDAKYAENGEMAYLTITIPNANVKQAPLELKQAVSGSGERYVNDMNPDEVYEWQTKANDGVFTITKSGSQPFTMVCRAS